MSHSVLALVVELAFSLLCEPEEPISNRVPMGFKADPISVELDLDAG